MKISPLRKPPQGKVVPEARTRSHFCKHNFGQERHRLEGKLKLRSLYQGISHGSVNSLDPYDFKNEFKKMSNKKLNDSSGDIKVEKSDLLQSVH